MIAEDSFYGPAKDVTAIELGYRLMRVAIINLARHTAVDRILVETELLIT